jgi:hypothetical protein
MKTRMIVGAVLAAGLIGFLAGNGFSDDVQPTEEQMMKMIEELATPGPGHKLMEPMAGDFDAESTLWMQPGDENPVKSTASASSKWILGGRYLVTDYSGDMKGMPFTGLGILAFDNFKQQYQSAWIDSFSTGIGMSTGAASTDGKSFTVSMTWDGPMGKIPMETQWIVVDKDNFMMRMHMEMGGVKFKHMELKFKRRAKAASAKRGACCPERPGNRGPGY